MKVDRSKYDPSRPLLEELNRGAIKYYSAFSQNLQGLPTTKGQQRDSAAGTIRSYFVNWNLNRVYMFALGHFLYYPPNHMVCKVKDRNRYLPTDSSQPYDNWKLANNFCYESVLPLNMSNKERMASLIADLNRYSGSNVRKEMQWRDCWLVVKSEEAPKALMPNSFGSCAIPCPSHWHLSLKDFLFELNDVKPNPPVIDSSGHTGPFDLVISREDLCDIASLRKHLQPLGLDIVPARRQVEVVVVEEVGEAVRR